METVKLEKLINDVTGDLNKQGVQIKERTVKLILDTYLKHKFNQLAVGNAVEEPDICTMHAKYRWSNTYAKMVVPTIKLQTTIKKKMKKKVLINMCISDEVCKDVVGDVRFSPEDLKAIREDLGIGQ